MVERSIRLPARFALGSSVVLFVAGCASAPPIPTEARELSLLTDRQIADLIEHPARWNGRTIRMQVFPYDNGYAESVRLCWEPCREEELSSDGGTAILYGDASQYSGMLGQQAVIVTATFSDVCFRDSGFCPDLLLYRFYEDPDDVPLAR